MESSLLPVFPFNAVNTTFQLGDDSLNRQYRNRLKYHWTNCACLQEFSFCFCHTTFGN